MKYCPNCGNSVNEGQDICLNCGKALTGRAAVSTNVDDVGGAKWWILGFIIPLLGIILYFSWKDQQPNKSKSLLNGSIVGIIIGVIGAVVSTIIQMSMLGAYM